MTTPLTAKPGVTIGITRLARTRQPIIAAGAEQTGVTYDLSGTAYRVVVGCCTQEESTKNTSHSRLAPAKATTSVRAKEVIS
jgi:hypothetical protein